MNWIAFFSQTGSEIVNISNKMGIKPELIVTNNTNEEKHRYHPGIREMGVTIMQARHEALMAYFERQSVHDIHNTVITLHGYLRIIPPNVCNRYKMYNGHPANIKMYPELKGKDPQVRTWENRELYTTIGSVIHRVTPGVDDGDIVQLVTRENDCTSLDDMFDKLKQTSLRSWELFFGGN